MPPVGFVFLTIPKAAAWVGVEERTIRAALKEGMGPPVTQLSRRKLIRSDLLADWIAQRTTQPQQRAT